MTDIIICTVPDCDAQAVLVLKGCPICRPHCEDFAKQASIVDGSFRDILKAPAQEALPMMAGPSPSGLDVVADASLSGLPSGPDPTDRPLTCGADLSVRQRDRAWRPGDGRRSR